MIPWSFFGGQSLVELIHYIVNVRYLLYLNKAWANVLCYSWVITYFYHVVGFLVASCTIPGYVQDNWLEHAGFVAEQVTRKGKKPFCLKCNRSRPLRAHHCKECNRCIMMMDHHCVFIDNCVGIRNFRPVYLFLCLFPVHAVLMIATIFARLGDKANPFQIIVLVLSLLYFPIFTIIVVAQLVQQTSLLLRNATCVEDEEKDGVKYLYKKMHQENLDEFDTGSVVANIKEKMGHKVWMWFLPIPNNEIRYTFRRNPKFVPEYLLIDDYKETPESIGFPSEVIP